MSIQKPERPFNIRLSFSVENRIDGITGFCPRCGNHVNDHQDSRECSHCGQRLDWD